ncbi:stalk domain-containing protein [Paenibacillus sepulcri]|uniref:Copper amine oxidase n=1 Tax=Paenibacillus sepulcri TaxID=359917 RepID=A0ABS7BVH1_9BACL|nr:copper amine oxidase [Paenibacillus sepulcri]
MKRLLGFFLVLCLLVVSANWTAETAAAAAAAQPKMVDIVGGNTLLLDDGSLWTYGSDGHVHNNLNLAAIAGNGINGYGLTRDGKVVSWNRGIFKPETEYGGVRLVTEGAWLKTDGTVWNYDGPIKELDGTALIVADETSYASLSQTGDILYGSRKLGKVSAASDIVMMDTHDGRTALLDRSGTIVIYDIYNLDKDTLEVIPETMTEDAVHLAYANDGTLLVTRKDGTVWKSGEYQERYKLTQQISGLSNITRTSALDDDSLFYAKKADGSWLIYNNEVIKPLVAPAVQSITFALDKLAPNVGDKVKAEITELYSNQAKIKVPLGKANVTVQKPHLLKPESDGTFKVMGVGETQVTVTSGGVSKTVTVSASLGSALQNAKQVKGVVFLPVKPVFQALGGTVSYTAASKSFAIKVGQTTIVLTSGSVNALLNGKPYKMKAAPLVSGGETLFPAGLLADALGAKLQWDTGWQEMNITFGKAKMTVQSAETAKIEKREAQGSLTAFIGKTYWVNHFQGWERFVKLTVADIEPDKNGYFEIVFKTASNKELKSYAMPASNVQDTLTDGYSFTNYDPYKKYKWSSSVWNAVKAEKISMGMTKEQVLLSWGNPSSKSSLSSGGINVETWGYSGFNYVTFTNGKVSGIYTG